MLFNLINSRKKHSSGIFDLHDEEMKGKLVKSSSRFHSKIALPVVVTFCLCFFLAGFFGSSFFSQGDDVRRRTRMLVSTRDNSGESSEDDEEYLTGIPSKVISWSPRAVYFPEFASPAQCRAIIERARLGLSPSTLALREGETPETTKGVRTSSGVFISASEDKTGILDIVEEKIAKVTMLPRAHYEAFNILRYEVGQLYKAHYDAFHAEEYGPQKSQRIATFLLYLSDVEEGGETMFPYVNGSNMDGNYDFTECIGLTLKPRQGDGLLFYSLYPNGTIDPTSLHGSCPVVKGEKWVATKWIRDQIEEDK